MNRDMLISIFSDHANEMLMQGANLDEDKLSGWRQHDEKLVQQMLKNFEEARAPRNFFNIRIVQPDGYFEQAFELLRTTFSPDVLSTREGYLNMLSSGEAPRNWIAVGRFWRVSGNHTYDTDGNLVRYGFSPLESTESIASYIEGSYMPMGSDLAMAGLGYLATRRAMRRGRGHGTALVNFYESELMRLAESNNETLDMIVLESESDARPFWYRKGYRWPQGSIYMQPPMTFDQDTGEPISNAVPELLMVKIPNEPDAVKASRSKILEIVRFLYESWYVTECNNANANERHRQYIFGELFGQVEASLPEANIEVDLVEPPVATY